MFGQVVGVQLGEADSLLSKLQWSATSVGKFLMPCDDLRRKDKPSGCEAGKDGKASRDEHVFTLASMDCGETVVQKSLFHG